MNSIFGEQKYNKPFLLTYLNTATFSLYLVPLLFSRRAKASLQPDENTKLLSGRTDEQELNHPEMELDQRTFDQQTDVTSKLSTTATIKLSLAFCILWFFANYTTNASLAYTSVGSSTILASMSGLFTLGIGSLFGVEQLNIIKVISVCVSLIGVMLVSYSDQQSSPGDDRPALGTAPLVGDLLALSGAVFYGCYTTLLKLRIQDESRINMPLFFGFVGAFNVLLLWPVFPLLHWLGIETFEIPSSPLLWIMVVLNAFIGTFLSDYLWLLAMLMTSPLVVTLGISLTIPLALVGDIVFKQFVPSVQYAAGAVLVGIGFFAVNMDALHAVEKQDAQSELSPEDDEAFSISKLTQKSDDYQAINA
ncbi:hypothetical protein DFQ28_010558 [Apophysomyces sp. BC1034]|nr:hypothetical protein DFQ30_001562 [Apophysomyces sp. BC1015]KAG0183525.1 hypothetical protein DFQ29_002579 [Apophysomyces sp. BC1021]KAG0194474.1 hypothetical protein DFQ28_010558 [Apophysomyces sp. BC1034]